MGPVSLKDLAGLPRLAPIAIVAIGALSAVATSGANAEEGRIVPAIGTYKSSGRGDPPSYGIRAQVKRRSGHQVISAQVTDTCGGFATFYRISIAGAGRGEPEFSARVGGATISGRWTASTTIRGSVKSPCAKRQDYVMRLSG